MGRGRYDVICRWERGGRLTQDREESLKWTYGNLHIPSSSEKLFMTGRELRSGKGRGRFSMSLARGEKGRHQFGRQPVSNEPLGGRG